MVNNSFNEIYKDIVPRLQSFLRHGWNLSNEDIEEIIHDVLLVLHNKTLSNIFKWNKSWLYKTTNNKAIDKIRSNKNYREYIEINNNYEPISTYLTPEEELIDSNQRIWIHDFLQALDGTNRKIAYLYYFEEISCNKIGSIINIPTGTIKYRLSEIRKKLEKEYIANETK